MRAALILLCLLLCACTSAGRATGSVRTLSGSTVVMATATAAATRPPTIGYGSTPTAVAKAIGCTGVSPGETGEVKCTLDGVQVGVATWPNATEQARADGEASGALKMAGQKLTVASGAGWRVGDDGTHGDTIARKVVALLGGKVVTFG